MDFIGYTLGMNSITNTETEETDARPELIVTRGISNSGKSTWAKSWVAEDPEKRRRVNRDDIRAAGLNIASQDFEEEKLITSVQYSFVKMHLKQRRSVVIDDMFLRARYVRPYYQLAQELDVDFVVKPFPIALDVAIKRAEKRTKDGGLMVPSDQIEEMFRRFTANGSPHPLPDFSAPVPVQKGQKSSRKNILLNIERYLADKSLPKAIIVDLDGTLTIGIHPDRRAYDWHKVGLDILNEQVAEVVRIMHAAGHLVLITSGRDNVCRAETIDWLVRHAVPYDEIFMRNNADMESDDVVKLEIFNARIRNSYNVRAVFDDRLRVVRTWHALGLPLFRVGDPDADF